ncbi:MAG: hypothetical protein M3Y09_08345, partial [Actinomycetota bacterium]|nr:hypothetical protein [Actinomycetota bacterium]
MGSRRWSRAVLVCGLLAALVPAATPAGAAIRRTPTLAQANTVVDGPSAGIVGLSGMAVARDGTGALVYVRNDTGATHVFVSVLRNGVFQASAQVDTGLAGPSSQPVVAVTNNGLIQIAFINAGTLYTVGTANSRSPFTAPVAIAGGASNPSLSLSTYGKGYLAFTATDPAHPRGHDVRYAALISGQWVLSGSPLDQNPADDAGAGTARPRVVCAGDGTGIATWGENGHIFARRILG